MNPAVRPLTQLRADALAIWQAGVAAVRGDRLVREQISQRDGMLEIAGQVIDLGDVERIIVVGAGKASAGMASGLEDALGPQILREKHVTGWINVPSDCVSELTRVHLHSARPAGRNEPMPEGVIGSRRILELVRSLTPRDLCICLLSGGGSALLPAPPAAISLEEKWKLTRFLSAAGANIEELNTVRKQLSEIKGGKLARACRAGHLITLVISDVLGDPLEIIGSGPTTPDSSTPRMALDILKQYDQDEQAISENIYRYLREQVARSLPMIDNLDPTNYRNEHGCHVVNEVIGNLATAVDAAGIEAESRGYSHAMWIAPTLEGFADHVGRHLAEQSLKLRTQAGPDCLITGGEPVVKLAPPEERGVGGRNQQLALAALESWRQANAVADGIVLLSGGTDGEDGPTNAAGAWIDAETIELARSRGLDPSDYLRRNDAYNFFDPLARLLVTGPTHTNVGDLRVVVVDRIATPRNSSKS